MRQVVETEVVELKQNFGDRRRTHIVSLESGTSSQNLLTTTDLTPARVVWVGVTPEGTIARTHNEDLPRVSGTASAALADKDQYASYSLSGSRGWASRIH